MADNTPRERPPANRRRDKVQLSCNPCRRRKRRCDRHQPCGACSRRGLANSCHYVTTISSSTLSSSTTDAPPALPQRHPNLLHARIAGLEKLVMDFMESQALPDPSAPNSPTTISPSSAHVLLEERQRERQHEAASPADPGTLGFGESGTSYVQNVHWEAILAQIRGLKEDLVADSNAPAGSHLFYGPHRYATRAEILAAVPLRPAVDRLMAIHFDSHIITPYLLHRDKFLREYEAFWEDPSTVSIAWIGLMFAMLSIAAQLQSFAVDLTNKREVPLQEEQLTTEGALREKAVQCLILARYTTGGPYILETLITILTGEFTLVKTGTSDGWLLIGLILRLAIRMGYHRDPNHFPGLSSFEGEMRRRIWTVILQLDLSLSLEMGLPRNATDKHIDTSEPHNLRDCDFDEDTAFLPTPRPETEWTPILPLLARRRLITALGLICDVNTNAIPPSPDEIIKIDKLLKDVYDHAIPPVLRWENGQHPITDSPNLVVQRVSVHTTYHKARILLYRRALISDAARQPQDRNREAVRICLDSAIQILSLQEMLHNESQPFGRLCQLRWKVNHILNQDVLLATSVLCLYLQNVCKSGSLETAVQTAPSPTDEDIRQKLIISHRIWCQMSATSAQAAKVAKALSIVLGQTEASAGDSSGLDAFNDWTMDFDFVAMADSSTGLNNYYLSSRLHSPFTVFNNILETWET